MGEDRHEKGLPVTPRSDVGLAEDWAEILERAEARRAGVSRIEARPIVARKIGVPEGKLYSLSRGRLKDVGSATLKRIGEGLLVELQSELARVEHDLQIRTQIGARRDSGESLALLGRREAILQALGLTDSPSGGEG